MAFKDISNVEDFVHYLDKPFSRTGGKRKDDIYVYHYTCLESLVKILESKSLVLTSPKIQNDMHEYQMFEESAWNGLYSTSFVRYHEESVAMWSMYGKKWDCAVKIGFQVKSLEEAIKQSNLYYFNNYEKGKKIMPCDGEIGFSSVAYKSEKNLHCGSVFNKKLLDKFKEHKFPNNCAGYIKSDIWDYEQEVRLIARLKKIEAPIERLVIDFDKSTDLWETLTVTTSPLFKIDMDSVFGNNGLLRAEQIKVNPYKDLIHIHQPCNSTQCHIINNNGNNL